jgi:hypothetical protein
MLGEKSIVQMQPRLERERPLGALTGESRGCNPSLHHKENR